MSPLVSIIIPTYNSEKFLARCLDSLFAQGNTIVIPSAVEGSSPLRQSVSEASEASPQPVIPDSTSESRNKNKIPIEIIVVDNNSTDATAEIAKKYPTKFFQHGPERSAQVNFGVTQSQGEYVYKVDADFVLDPGVVVQCTELAREGFDAVVVHNSPDTSVSWIAKVRKFEVDMYKYDLTHSSARFVKKSVYTAIGGFDETITAGEDYDFQNKLNRRGVRTGFIDAEALHLGEPTSFWEHMRKYYEYGKDFVNYQAKNKKESKQQLSLFRSVYFKHWKKFAQHPLLGIGFIFYNLSKYSAGGLGYLYKKLWQ